MEFSKEQFETLKKTYKKAFDAGLDTFPFYGELLATSYAKYLIEFLETKFK